MKILLLDNFDSFTFNLYHYLQISGAEVVVKRNTELSISDLHLTGFDAAVLSPGPGIPQSAGALMEFVKENAGKKPVLGVCLGMQAIGVHCGWELLHSKMPRHGKSSQILHSKKGIFEHIPDPMQVGRYHSLIIRDPGKNTALTIEADCDGEVMAVSGAGGLIWGVQFHPESILTPFGQQLINNWVGLAASFRPANEPVFLQ